MLAGSAAGVPVWELAGASGFGLNTELVVLFSPLRVGSGRRDVEKGFCLIIAHGIELLLIHARIRWSSESKPTKPAKSTDGSREEEARELRKPWDQRENCVR